MTSKENRKINAEVLNFFDTSTIIESTFQQVNIKSLYILVNDLLNDNIALNNFLISYLMFGIFSVFFFFKLNVAPFHSWALSIYKTTSILSGFFLNIFVKIIYVLFFLYFNLAFTYYLGLPKLFIILFGCCFSVLVGLWGAFYADEIKILYIYSTINHLGFILIPVILGNYINVFSISVEYLILYLVNITIIWTFLFILGLNYRYLTQVKTLRMHFLFIFLYVISFFSLAGIPPLSGFYIKLKILMFLYEYTFFDLGSFFLLTSIISIFYYIRVIKILLFETNYVVTTYKYMYNLFTDVNIYPFFLCFFCSFIILFYVFFYNYMVF